MANRLKEPSTWAGIAVLAQLVAGIFGKTEYVEPIAGAITAIGGVVAVFVREKGKKDAVK